MQPDGSQLFESLKVYLNNTKRLQPVIGLDSIIECVTAGWPNREPLYWCTVCVFRCGKADIRNHIFGSQHRFNYIKAWHPHLVQTWQDECHLSEKAWALMELAKTVETEEGTGQAKLLEVEATAYQMMATLSESDAVTLLSFLTNQQSEALSSSDATAIDPPTESQRIVVGKQWRGSQESLKDTETTPELDDLQTWHGVPEVTGSISGSFGAPVTGLHHVVEYRSESGSSSCFLCHCCRIRSSSRDISDHLTSSSHLLNSLTETHPEVLEEVTAEMKDSCEFLRCLAQRLEPQEDRDLKVIVVPEYICRQLTAKSYHWCVKMLHTKWTHADFQETKDTLKAKATETAAQGMQEKSTVKPKRRAKSNKTGSSACPLFRVSLPLNEGALLLERKTSCSLDSPSPGLDLSHSAEAQTLDCHTGSFPGNYDDHTSSGTSHFQQDLYDDGTDADVFIPKKNLKITIFKDASEGSREDLYYGQYEHEYYEDGRCSRLQSSQGTSSEQWRNDEDLEAFPAASCSREEHSEYTWHGSTSGNTETQVGAAGVETHSDTSSDAARHYDLQRCQNASSLLTGGASVQAAPQSDWTQATAWQDWGGAYFTPAALYAGGQTLTGTPYSPLSEFSCSRGGTM